MIKEFNEVVSSPKYNTIIGTPTNVHDLDQLYKLIRPDDEVVYGDSGYTGALKRAEIQNNKQLSNIDFVINRRPSSMRDRSNYSGFDWDKEIERKKSSVRCKVEHVFAVVKRLFGYRKTRYRGLRKQMLKSYIMFALANLYLADRKSLSV